jgi:hypothetical protein
MLLLQCTSTVSLKIRTTSTVPEGLSKDQATFTVPDWKAVRKVTAVQLR